MAFPVLGGEEVARGDFGEDEEGDEPAPDEQAQLDIMPEGDKGEDDEHVRHRPCRGPRPRRAAAAAKRNVHVAHGPAVEAAVPATPECEGGVVVRHAANHVFRGVDAVEERPEAEEAPGEEKLEPDVVEAEVANHAEFEGGIEVPCGLGFGDGDDVGEVEHDFHGEKGDEEADTVEEGPGCGYACEWVALLRDVVVER